MDLVADGTVSDASSEAGIYIHFPFCRHMCTYCDFDTFTGLERLIDSYVGAAVRQIELSPAARGTSLYIGGGTPSIMTPDQAGMLATACRGRFQIHPEAEVTIEANPTDMDAERMIGFRRAGFNRLSIGVQSADARLLRLLGRRHGVEDAAAGIRCARSAGFDNVSIDLIYGVPMQSLDSWRTTLETVAKWGVDHLSCYMLTVEPGTPLDRGVSRGTIQTLTDDQIVAMYELAVEYLGSAGYRHYEISNWARPGRESIHNLTYWRNRSYLGIGAGAAGYWEGTRYKVLPRVQAFVEGAMVGCIPLAENEEIDARRAMSETLILGLRLLEGVSIPEFERRHGASPCDEFGDALAWAEESGLLERTSDRLTLTRRGVLLSNELFEKLL